MSEWVELGRDKAKTIVIWMLLILVLLIVGKTAIRGIDSSREHEVFQYKCNKENGIYLKQYKGYVCVKQGEIIWKRIM